MMKSINILDLQNGFDVIVDHIPIMEPLKPLSAAESGPKGCSLLPYSSLSDKLKNEDIEHNDEKNMIKDLDVHALLAQKEKDLILAAELGKALLEKNEDLSQNNEKMAEDFCKQLEVRTCIFECFF